ncbi:SRPBCC domain-containing protein [Kribbella sp. CCNWLW197]
MSVTSIDKDFDALTLTLIADFDATAERVWELWADPRLLERWWGPPTHPATMVEHDLTAGGEVAYYMTSPEGEKYHGRWQLTAVDPPKSLEFIDAFADADGKPVEGMPTNTVRMELSGYDGGTRMELRSTFDSREQMDQLIGMGMAEGLEQAVSQIDALLA